MNQISAVYSDVVPQLESVTAGMGDASFGPSVRSGLEFRIEPPLASGVFGSMVKDAALTVGSVLNFDRTTRTIISRGDPMENGVVTVGVSGRFGGDLLTICSQ